MIDRLGKYRITHLWAGACLALAWVILGPPIRADDTRCAELIESAPADADDVRIALEVLETCPDRYRLEILSDESEYDPFLFFDELEPQEAREVLGRVSRFVSDESDPWVIYLTGVDLAEWVDESDDLDSIFETLLTHRAPGVRRSAVDYFGEYGRRTELLRDMWESETDSGMLSALIGALAYEGYGLPGVDDLMWHTDQRLAARAIGVVAHEGGDDRYSRLIERASAGSPELRRLAISELGLVVRPGECQGCADHELDEDTLRQIEQLAASVWESSKDTGLRSEVMELYTALDDGPGRAIALAREEAWVGPGDSSSQSVYLLTLSESEADRDLLMRLAVEAPAETRAQAIAAIDRLVAGPKVERIITAALAPGQPRSVRHAALGALSGSESIAVLRIKAGVDPAPPRPTVDEHGSPEDWGPKQFAALRLAGFGEFDEEQRAAAQERLDRALFAAPLLRQLADDDPEEWVRERAVEELESLFPEDPTTIETVVLSCGMTVRSSPGTWTSIRGDASQRCMAGPGHEDVKGGIRAAPGEVLGIQQRFHDGDRLWVSVYSEESDSCWLEMDRLRIQEAEVTDDPAEEEPAEPTSPVRWELDLPRERIAGAAFSSLLAADIVETFDPGIDVVGVRIEIDPRDDLALGALKGAASLRDTALDRVVEDLLERRSRLGLDVAGWEAWSAEPEELRELDPVEAGGEAGG
ncbi:hypothetical protein ABI59_20455 [Acidobacteria bacterium Mor1]|nr:hypothetical protein ABI59_20455 [Acidobacteria bacterium Mor1]